MAKQDAFGGQWLRPPGNGSAVVFVHGILSSSEGAWTHENGAFWPGMLATDSDLPGIGVGLFAYRADWRSGTYSASDAADLLREFVCEAGLWNRQSLIFVCHSMGGIVVRRFLIANQHALIDGKSHVGLFFIASPSLGSVDANRILGLARLLANVQAENLRMAEDNVWLNDLDKDFLKLKDSGRLSIRGKELIEDEPVFIKKLLGLPTKVVEPPSAARYFSDSLKIPGSNHGTVAKPESRGSEQYKALRRFIQSVTSIGPPYLAALDSHETTRAVGALSGIQQTLASGTVTESDALAAIQDALLDTRSYLRRISAREPRDAKSEEDLSRVWSNAGRAVLPYYPKLAELCWVKGNGWADESVWTHPRYKDMPLSVNDMLDKLLQATSSASKSAQHKEYQPSDIAEGTIHLDTMTWRTALLIRPFSEAPKITLLRKDSGVGEPPAIEFVTPDSFAATIGSTAQAGDWKWRARGKAIDSGIDIVEGEVSLSFGQKTTVWLPPFSGPPIISLVRPDGRSRRQPKLESVTEDAFSVSINNTEDAGRWMWRARGQVLARAQVPQ